MAKMKTLSWQEIIDLLTGREIIINETPVKIGPLELPYSGQDDKFEAARKLEKKIREDLYYERF